MKRIALFTLISSLILSGCMMLGKGPGKAKHEVKVTHSLGWWSKNANMTIESFDVKVVEQNLNLFNTVAQVQYTIKGKMKSNDRWKPYIGSVHISEEYELNDSAKQIAVIKLTPVMHTKSDKKHKGGETAFSVTNEHNITSYRWGQNQFRFICGNFVKEITINQQK